MDTTLSVGSKVVRRIMSYGINADYTEMMEYRKRTHIKRKKPVTF